VGSELPSSTMSELTWVQGHPTAAYCRNILLIGGEKFPHLLGLQKSLVLQSKSRRKLVCCSCTAFMDTHTWSLTYTHTA
jgi:hypothetical protein